MSDLGKLEKKLWAECKRIIRARYPHDCYTCEAKNIEGCNMQTGHFYPKGALGASMKYDLRILRLQCMRCNIHHGGMGSVYANRLEKELGKSAYKALYDECRLSKGKPIKAFDHYTKLLTEYKKITE